MIRLGRCRDCGFDCRFTRQEVEEIYEICPYHTGRKATLKVKEDK